MKQTLFLVFFWVLSTSATFCQTNVGGSSRFVETSLKKYFKNNKVIVTKTDTTLVYLLRDSTLANMDIYSSFNQNNICTFQKVSFACDSCYQKFFKFNLAQKNFEWQSIGTDHYLSKYSRHLLLVGDVKNLNYTITLINYTKQEYNQLLNKNKPEVYY